MATISDHICLSCNQINPHNAKHCIQCGFQISIFHPHCAFCGISPPIGAKYCPECGSSLPPTPTDDASFSQPFEDNGLLDTGEYRQVTVLFCDMVESTRWVHDLGAETYRLVNFRYREICAPIVTKFGGKISRFMGDGFLALFGYPAAHEDDAQSATRAGLEITRKISESKFPIDTHPSISIEARVGIATGRVVSSEESHEGIPKELSVVGETPNLASRIQELAKPNTVLVNSITQRLIKNNIETISIGFFSLKGFPDPIELFQPIEIKAPVSQAPELISRSESPLIGRQSEIQILNDCWKHVQKNRGRIVLIQGDAGIGKSRLIREARKNLQIPQWWMEFRCSSYFVNSALYPIIERLKQLCDISERDSVEDVRCKLQGFCRPFLSFPEQLSVLVDLLVLEDTVVTVHPSQRSQPLDALVALFTSIAEENQLVLVIEDLHWIDPSTEIMLARLIDQIAMVPMLVLVTARSEHQVNWLNKNYALQITPAHLRPSDAEKMIEYLTKSTPIPTNTMAQLAYKTDGVPLYIEELTKAVVESVANFQEPRGVKRPLADLPSLDSNRPGAGDIVNIPETLRDSFMERLDRLGPTKNLAHLASVLGRSFSYEHIKIASDLTDENIKNQLEQLVKSDLLHQKGVPPRSSYIFKHSLIQDAAYDSILTSNRRIYHERIANRFSSYFQDADRANPELVARHYVLARKPEKSVARWNKAAQNALRRGTGLEAITHAVEGLSHIDSAPEANRTNLELELCITHAIALSATFGFAVPVVYRAFEKAYKLCNEHESNTEMLFPVLQGLQQVSLLGGSLIKARELGERLVAIASEGESLLDRRAEAHRCLGWTLFCLGKFQDAGNHIHIAMSLYDRANAKKVNQQVIVDAGGVGLANLAWISWFLGDTPEATKNAKLSIDHARDIDHPFTLAYTLCTCAAMYQFRQEPEAVSIFANEAVSIASQHKFKYWSAWGSSLVGWSNFMLHDKDDGIKLLRQGIKDYRETASNLLAPYIFTLLAECEIGIGLLDEALSTLDDAIEICSRYNIKFYSAEIHRLKADVYRQKGDRNKAVKNCEQALNIARKQGSLALELRVLVFTLESKLYEGQRDTLYNRMSEIIKNKANGADPHDAANASKLNIVSQT